MAKAALLSSGKEQLELMLMLCKTVICKLERTQWFDKMAWQNTLCFKPLKPSRLNISKKAVSYRKFWLIFNF